MRKNDYREENFFYEPYQSKGKKIFKRIKRVRRAVCTLCEHKEGDTQWIFTMKGYLIIHR
ncbi:hypothetical protein CER18_01130 [Bartonella tribocorum]|uniref:Uncharacterized protein n=1 Tax=Bartonella tribocorum TaxID=85701 RepID=A0A2M6UUU3_9HYPH|nr:hypothetical protein CER18_01130 [Bartonella tribocorum]